MEISKGLIKKADYLDIDYARQVYLISLYSSIIEDIESPLSHGEIVRQLIREGHNINDAEELYQHIKENRLQVVELVMKMKQNIEKIRSEYEFNQNIKLQKIDKDYLARKAQQEESMKQFEHFAVHTGEHLIAHLFKSFLGVG